MRFIYKLSALHEHYRGNIGYPAQPAPPIFESKMELPPPVTLGDLTDSDSEVAAARKSSGWMAVSPKAQPAANQAAAKRKAATPSDAAKAAAKAAKAAAKADKTSKMAAKAAKAAAAKAAAAAHAAAEKTSKMAAAEKSPNMAAAENAPNMAAAEKPSKKAAAEKPPKKTSNKRPAAGGDDGDEAADGNGGDDGDNEAGGDEAAAGSGCDDKGGGSNKRTNQYGESGRYAVVPYRKKGGCAVKDYTTGKELSRTYVACLAVLGGRV